MMADSIGVSVGELRELSSDGKLTSDIIKKAVLGNADEISAKYGKMPLTFSAVWQNMKSMGQNAMDGLLTKVNKLLNTPAGQKMAQDLQQGAVVLAEMTNRFTIHNALLKHKEYETKTEIIEMATKKVA